jgi:hypothetical protein
MGEDSRASSNALFMDGLLVCAARFLASAALCRYSSDRDDMQSEHWKDDSVPLDFTEPCDKCGVDQLAMAGRPAGRGKPRPVGEPTRRVGALTRSAPCLICALG